MGRLRAGVIGAGAIVREGHVPALRRAGVEVVAIWMMVYLTLSLSTSLLMNWFNARVALVER